jgi:hypothetical protein
MLLLGAACNAKAPAPSTSCASIEATLYERSFEKAVVLRTRLACEDDKWAEPVRACFVAATTADARRACVAKLPEAKRAKVPEAVVSPDTAAPVAPAAAAP